MQIKEEKMKFMVIDETGREIECEGWFSFESAETNKNYLVYTDNSEDEDGSIRVYGAVYQPDKKEGVLEPIETDEEFAFIEKALEKWYKQLEEKEE